MKIDEGKGNGGGDRTRRGATTEGSSDGMVRRPATRETAYSLLSSYSNNAQSTVYTITSSTRDSHYANTH